MSEQARVSSVVEEIFPIITARDLEALTAFYTEVLGGVQDYRFPDDGPASYVSLRFGGTSLGIAQGSPGERTDRIVLWLYVKSCDEATELVRSAGGWVVAEPEDQPWGERVARVHDPEGNELLLGQRA